MKLLIISHTEHYQDTNGTIFGWGPTITEINHLIRDFDEIFHVAFLYQESPPPSALPYISDNIRLIPLKPVGGNGLRNKLEILTSTPKILKTISKVLKQSDVFQFRAPTGMGIFVIPYVSLFSRKKGWFKYAGNWNQQSPPLGYAVQRRMLKIQNRPVTINGKWKNQPTQCLSFENPCLTEKERNVGKTILSEKKYEFPFQFCFVGRLEDAKGVQRILDAFKQIENRQFVQKIHFVGDGEKRDFYEKQAEEYELPAVFYGFLNREKVFEIYKKCHFFLLPSSASEGFPKVIAEAMNFGCLPIVSSVSSIGHYVNSKNGFILEPCSEKTLAETLNALSSFSESDLKNKATQAHQKVEGFTFSNYRHRIQTEILNNRAKS